MRRKENSILSNIKNLVLENIIKYFKEYTIVTICFVIGVIVGVIFINNLADNQSNEIEVYINSFLETLHSDVNFNYLELLKNSLIQNFLLVLALWFLGATLIGIPIVFAIILFRGFCLGYTISAIIHILGISKGVLFVVTTMFLHNLLFIPAIIALAVSGIRLYQTVVKNRNAASIKFALLKHSIFALIIMLILVLSSIIEVFISTNLFSLICNFLVTAE